MATTVARTCLNITCMLIVSVLLATNNIYISKVIPYGVAQRLVRGIALLLHDRGTERGWVVSSTPRPHFTSGKDPVPILQVAGWAPGPVWTGGKSRPEPSSNRYIDWATRPVCVCVCVYIYILMGDIYLKLGLCPFFFSWSCPLFYLLSVGVEGYHWSWSRSMTNTHTFGRTPLDEGWARRRYNVSFTEIIYRSSRWMKYESGALVEW